MNHAQAILVALLAIALWSPATRSEEPEPRSPILVTFDLHMDPMSFMRDVDRRRQMYRDWSDAARWLLDVADRRGAKISFCTVGEFAEFCLADPDHAFPLIRKLYASGGSVGTHSHTWIREGEFSWQDAGMRGGKDGGERIWADDVGLVDRLVSAVFGVIDPQEIRKINNLRGTHAPESAADRQALFARYGFEVCQAGPGEDFFGLFHHYLYHPFRSGTENELCDDPHGKMILTQAGPVLGATGVHKGIEQDMSVARVQAEFLQEVLDWLHDAETGAVDRVWCFGWGMHGSDIAAKGVSRPCVEPTLDWFNRYFVGKTVGGRTIARYGSYREEADAALAWEKAHPGVSARGYPDRKRDWADYPWLAPVAAYLWDARYVAALRSDDTVQAHRLDACDELGGPYPIVVAFPVRRGETALDLSAVDAGKWTRIDPATGAGVAGPAASQTVPAAGAIFVPSAVCPTLEEQKRRIDRAYPRELPQSGGRNPARGGGEGSPLRRLDRNGDGRLSRDEFPGTDEEFTRLDRNADGGLDAEELEAGRPGR